MNENDNMKQFFTTHYDNILGQTSIQCLRYFKDQLEDLSKIVSNFKQSEYSCDIIDYLNLNSSLENINIQGAVGIDRSPNPKFDGSANMITYRSYIGSSESADMPSSPPAFSLENLHIGTSIGNSTVFSSEYKINNHPTLISVMSRFVDSFTKINESKIDTEFIKQSFISVKKSNPDLNVVGDVSCLWVDVSSKPSSVTNHGYHLHMILSRNSIFNIVGKLVLSDMDVDKLISKVDLNTTKTDRINIFIDSVLEHFQIINNKELVKKVSKMITGELFKTYCAVYSKISFLMGSYNEFRDNVYRKVIKSINDMAIDGTLSELPAGSFTNSVGAALAGLGGIMPVFYTMISHMFTGIDDHEHQFFGEYKKSYNTDITNHTNYSLVTAVESIMDYMMVRETFVYNKDIENDEFRDILNSLKSRATMIPEVLDRFNAAEKIDIHVRDINTHDTQFKTCQHYYEELDCVVVNSFIGIFCFAYGKDLSTATQLRGGTIIGDDDLKDIFTLSLHILKSSITKLNKFQNFEALGLMYKDSDQFLNALFNDTHKSFVQECIENLTGRLALKDPQINWFPQSIPINYIRHSVQNILDKMKSYANARKVLSSPDKYGVESLDDFDRDELERDFGKFNDTDYGLSDFFKQFDRSLNEKGSNSIESFEGCLTLLEIDPNDISVIAPAMLAAESLLIDLTAADVNNDPIIKSKINRLESIYELLKTYNINIQ